TSPPAHWWRLPPWLSACRGGARRERLPLKMEDAVRQCVDRKAPCGARFQQKPDLSRLESRPRCPRCAGVALTFEHRADQETRNEATGRAPELHSKIAFSQLGDSSMVEQRTLTPLI